MASNALRISDNFRKMAVKSAFSIVLFLIIYFILVILGIGIIFLCGLCAYWLIILKPMVITIMLGLGFLGMGFLIFFYLVKFMFSISKVDRSQLIEVTPEQQPELFEMIREIVAEVKTDFPKKVYFSYQVNASVFYDSSFWSMFFPVKKNLEIGFGLLNSVSVIELKAILAHEFGHFSQRSMKVGSYVYYVNKVIYNMLYDNEGYNNILNKWANVSAYFNLFSSGAILVIRGIQYILIKVYDVVNLNYLALSREMEFHADAVAAYVVGSEPLASSLLRIELSGSSLSAVLNYYNAGQPEPRKTKNFYPQHSYVLHYASKLKNLPLQNGLPQLTADQYKDFNKSNLVLNDQWSSHPGTEERVSKLLQLNQPVKSDDTRNAFDILVHKDQLQEQITSNIFNMLAYGQTPVDQDTDEFIADFEKRNAEYSFPDLYRGYYDERNPYAGFNEESFKDSNPGAYQSLEKLFGDDSMGMINALYALTNDLEVINKLYSGEFSLKTFDYKGQKYISKECSVLIRQLEEEIVHLKKVLEDKDEEIFNHFLHAAVLNDKTGEFKERSLAYQMSAHYLKDQESIDISLCSAIQFMQTKTPLETIKEQMFNVKRIEPAFKAQIQILLDNQIFEEFTTEEMKANFLEYLSKDFEYFGYDIYYDKEVSVLFDAVVAFQLVYTKTFFKMKKSLLEFQADLTNL